MTLSLVLLVAGIGIFYLWSLRIGRRPLPPGPPKDPLIGHLRYMPTAQAPFVFHEWAKIYGDVMHLQVLGKSMIVLDTLQAAVDLLDKKGAIYPDRPPLPLYELLGWTYMLSFMRYGEIFTRHRRVHQSFFSRPRCAEFEPMQTQEARRLVRNLFESPTEKYGAVLSKFTTSILVSVVAGHKIGSDDDPYLELSKMVYQVFSVTGPPGGTPIDFFPPLRYFPSWFPGAYYAGVARAWRPVVRRLYNYPLECVQRQREAGNASPSFLLSQLEEIDSGSSELNYEELKGAAATLFGAELPTRSAVAVFLLAMVLNPECQIRAQKEIDSVVGISRLPTFQDRAELPFVEWNPVAPLGVPHRSTQDDVYRGMYIPKGSLILANVRGMSLDENTYKNPTKFIPERFLPPPLGNGEPYFSCLFGFGRRKCPAVHFVERNLWIAIVSILATCTISNALDEHGSVIVPEASMSDGVDSYPNDLRCVIKPRFKEVKGLLEESILSSKA
ncbi:Cytochrome P450 [Mycena sanguinolenta]|uniref:Cytochrome P450 n=1 Tax=Mycena sanguinolenta TaxID=230812 RepID=A0A8H6X3C3_9AGAR|nr:Cytochrome P450 [Mycena sanguinolenta]